jgi:hypothetical protein
MLNPRHLIRQGLLHHRQESQMILGLETIISSMIARAGTILLRCSLLILTNQWEEHSEGHPTNLLILVNPRIS